MTNGQKPSWLDWLAHGWQITVFVTVLTVGVGWGGWGQFLFFSPPSTPPTNPPTTSATINNPEDEDKHKPESDQDSTSTSLLTESERTNRLDGTPELKTLTEAESDWDSVSLLDPPSSVSGSEIAIGIPELEIKLEVETDLRRILALSQDLLIQKGNLF